MIKINTLSKCSCSPWRDMRGFIIIVSRIIWQEKIAADVAFLRVKKKSMNVCVFQDSNHEGYDGLGQDGRNVRRVRLRT